MKRVGKRPVGLKCILYLKQLTKHSSSYHFVSLSYFSLDPFSRLQLMLSSSLCNSQGASESGCYPGPVATQELVDTRTRRLLWELQPPSHWIHYPNPSLRKGHPSFCSLSLWEIIPPGTIWKDCEALLLRNHNKELSDSPLKKGMLYIYAASKAPWIYLDSINRSLLNTGKIVNRPHPQELGYHEVLWQCRDLSYPSTMQSPSLFPPKSTSVISFKSLQCFSLGWLPLMQNTENSQTLNKERGPPLLK